MVFATDESLERILREIKNPENLNDVRAFLEEKRANGARLSTLVNHANHLRHWGVFLGARGFRDATKEDVRRFINQRGGRVRVRPRGKDIGRPDKIVYVSETTMNIRKVLLRAFQKWLRGLEKDDPYPPEVAWLKQTRRPDDDTMLEEVITREELLQLIEAQDNAQHKALFAVLYDSGMRAGEILSLRIRDITIDEYGAVLTLPKGAQGLKTGARRVRVIHCTPYLVRWMNEHPRKSQPNHHLWVAMGRSNLLGTLNNNTLYALLQRSARKAGFTDDRHLHPHLFRHSRATEAVKEGMRESEMRLFFGWSRNSDMPSRYIHLAGADVEEGILRRAGVLKDAKHQPALEARKCVCGNQNMATAEYCEAAGCNRPLTPKAVEKREQTVFRAMLDKMDEETLRAIAEKVIPQALDKAREKKGTEERQ